MTGRMNWERVHKENLAYRHGSQWVSSFETVGAPPKRKSKKKKTRKKRKNVVLPQDQMTGCSCGKAMGFKGEHKMSCPLRQFRLGSPAVRASVGRKAALPRVIYVPPSEAAKESRGRYFSGKRKAAT